MCNSRNYLAVQRFGLCTFTTGVQVQSLVGELRSHKLPAEAKKGGGWGE